MKEQLSDNEKFAHLVEALRSWLPDLVIAGGWAHRLHRLHGFAESPGHLPLMTKDVDVALEKVSGSGSGLRDALRASGFREEMSGDAQPPVTHYRLGSPEQAFYVEFLTPLVGGENKRDGTPDVTVTIGGINAQKLRYLEILLLAPWLIVIGPEHGFPLAQPAALAVPNAAGYIAQKLLILGRRKREDQERDILYIHDTLQLFATHLADIRVVWHNDVVPHLPGRWTAGIQAAIRSEFSEVNDGIRGAAVIATSVGRSLQPRSLLAACQLGLERIFS